MSKSMYGTLSDKTVLPQPEPKQVRPRTTPSLPTVSPSRFVNGMYKTGLMAKNDSSYSQAVNMDVWDKNFDTFMTLMAYCKEHKVPAEYRKKLIAREMTIEEYEALTAKKDEQVEFAGYVETIDETPVQPEVKPEPAVLTEEFVQPSVDVEDKADLGPIEVEIPKLDEQPAQETTPKKKERKKKADAE